MAKTLNEFCDYLLSRVGCSLYVLGAQGQSIKGLAEDWIHRTEQTYSQNPDANTKRVMALLDKRLPDDRYFYDCSGLGIAWLLENKLVKSDMTANSMFTNLCSKVSKAELRRGDWVFLRRGSTGNISHIGYIVDDALNVVEAAGRDVGVIKRPLSKGSPNGAWNVFGRPDKVFDLSSADKPTAATIGRVLCLTSPMQRGDDVKALQAALIAKGATIKADGIFGQATETAVKAAQKQLWPGKPSEWDGKAGKKTVTALGLVWFA